MGQLAKKMQITALILLVLPCLITGQLVEVCDPADFIDPSGPPLPDIPSQFSATIEGNLLARSQTFVITEYYDQINDRGKIEFAIDGTKTVGIYDYTLEEVFLIPDPRGGDCRVFKISPSSSFLVQTFGFTEVNGTLHIGSPAAFLERIQENATTKFMGLDTVRGIPVYRWQSCVALPNNTYLIDYYFASQSNWTYGSQIDTSLMIPIQFNLNASFVGRRGIDNAYNIYTFVNYRTGPDSVPDDVFTVPTGLACQGRVPGQPLPTLSSYFSGRIELNIEYEGNKVLVTVQEYYDQERGLFRLDFYAQDGPTTLVHDFNQGVEFRISQTTNKCVVTPLSNFTSSLRFDFDVSSDTPSIASPNQLALLENFFNYSYEGVSTIRGVEVDSWVSVRDFEALPSNVNLTNAVYEVFFTRPGVTVVNEHSFTTTPVLLRAKLSGDFYALVGNSVANFTRSLQYDFFDISTQEPPYDAYDVSSCYAVEDVVSVTLRIPGQLTGFDLGDLRENIRVAISNYTGILPLQVAGVNIVDTNGTVLFVHVRIANLSTFSTISQDKRVSAATALQLLMDGTDSTTNPFTIIFPPNITVTPTIHARGQGHGNPSSCPTPPPTSAPVTCPTANTNVTTPPPTTVANDVTTPPPTTVANDMTTPPPTTVANDMTTPPPTTVANDNTTPPPTTVSTTPPSTTVANDMTTPPPTTVANDMTTPPPTTGSIAEPSTDSPTTLMTNMCTPPTTTCTCPTDSVDDLQRQLQLKNRELVGVAVGLLLIGILIGTLFTVLVICVYRCVWKGRSFKLGKGVKYQKQTDEVAFAT